jgi:energy-coupling factor transporter ATP-binding protein EcfA2
VLNKADVLAPALFAVRLAETEEIAVGAPVHALSAARGDGLDALAPYLVPGSTIALLGMSGVGKSTLVNALLGFDKMATGAVRDGDQRGRHTTTHRELVRLDSGAWLLDTPGMRVLALWGGEEGVSSTFDDVAAIAARCRFGDCAHQGEPGARSLSRFSPASSRRSATPRGGSSSARRARSPRGTTSAGRQGEGALEGDHQVGAGPADQALRATSHFEKACANELPGMSARLRRADRIAAARSPRSSSIAARSAQ